MQQNHKTITKFEQALAEFTGAPYAVAVDCCTHAIELCFRMLQIRSCSFSAYTYLSVPMTMNLLGIDYKLLDEQWLDEYQFYNTPIWDSARCLKPKMYRPNTYQCLSFGPSKPVNNIRGGAILCDNTNDYKKLKTMSYDGRDPTVARWYEQKEFSQGFHYMMRWEEEDSAYDKLKQYIKNGVFNHSYPPYFDCRNVVIK